MIKKMIVLLLFCTALLYSCRYNDRPIETSLVVEENASDIGQKPVNEDKHLSDHNDNVSNAETAPVPSHTEEPPAETNTGRRKHTPTFTNDYSEAYKAYREFLLGQRSAQFYQGWQELYFDYYTFGAMNSEFSLVDINHDGIPELHFRSRAYTMYSYRDGEVFRVTAYPSNAELMNNLSIYSDYWARNRITEATRIYIEFGEDLQPSFSLCFSFSDVNEIYRIQYFDQETPADIPKQSFDEITKPILDYCTDPRNYDLITWINFGEWLEQNIDEYIVPEHTTSWQYD